MLATPRAKGELFLASSLCDGLEDNNIRQVTTLLLSKEADPNVLIPSYGITPFHLVVGNDSETFAEEVTKLFLRHGGNPNVTSIDGLTPVHVAAAWGRLGVLELLLANGGDPLSSDDEGRTPFHYAFDGKYYKAITILGKYCTDATEKEEGLRYKRKLDKVFVNNGDMMAEYVVTERPLFGDDNAITMGGQSSVKLDYRAQSSEKVVHSRDTDCVQFDKNLSDVLTLSNHGYANDEYRCISSDKITLRKHRAHLPKTTSQMETREAIGNSNLKEIKLGTNVEEEKQVVVVGELDSSCPSMSVTTESAADDESPIILHGKFEKESQLSAQGVENHDKLLVDTGKYECLGFKLNKQQASLIPTLQRKAISGSDNAAKKPACSPKTPYRIKASAHWTTAGSTTSKKCRQHFSKIPVRLGYSPDDRIISKSPNFIVSTTTRIGAKTLASAKRLALDGFEESFKEFHLTPPRVANANKLLKRSKIAQSTPRRKINTRYNFSSVKRLKTYQNRVPRFSGWRDESTILSRNDGPMLSTPGGDSKKSLNSNRSGYSNPYAINLDECKYDEEHEVNVMENLSVDHLPVEMPASSMVEDDSDTGGVSGMSLVTSKGNSSSESLNNNTSFGRNLNNVVTLPNRRTLCHSDSMTNRTDDAETEHSEKKELSSADLSTIRKHDCTLNLCDKTSRHFTGGGSDSSLRLSTRTYVSIQEEYKYEDPDEGVILLERRYCVTPCRVPSGSDEDDEFLSAVESCSTGASFASDVPSEILLLDNFTLRSRLTQMGDIPGPITETTRHVYLKRLVRLQKKLENPVVKTGEKELATCDQIKSSLRYGHWVNELAVHCALEKRIFQEFTIPDPSRKWREGTAKASFNYLLLDSRITQDLPHRSAALSESDVWSIFVSSIFYIGKGKRSRPYAHLYDAFNCWVSKTQTSRNEKIQCILDIWNDGYGVVCLHVFQNIIPVEAYTREAAMIDAIGLENLRNVKAGEYYGIPATWSNKEKSKFGKYLLYKAMQILMHEGERQLFPQHL